MAKTMTKSEVLTRIAKSAGISRKQVGLVFTGLSDLIAGALKKKGAGLFVVPGLMKIVVVEKPAVPERMGINPFTKQEQLFKAKPARRVVKVRALKRLKDMAK